MDVVAVPVGTMEMVRRPLDTPGFSGCMAVIAAMPRLRATWQASTQARPYRPEPNAGPATSTSGLQPIERASDGTRDLLHLLAGEVVAADDGGLDAGAVIQRRLERAAGADGARPHRHADVRLVLAADPPEELVHVVHDAQRTAHGTPPADFRLVVRHSSLSVATTTVTSANFPGLAGRTLNRNGPRFGAQVTGPAGRGAVGRCPRAVTDLP